MQELIFDKKTHSYYLGNKKLISVSKIINSYLGSSYDGISKEVLKNAGIRGQWVHKVITKTNINNYLLCKKSLNFISKEITNINEYDIEKPIYFDEIAGTPDLLVKDKDKNYLIDFKTYSDFNKELKEKAEHLK